jgi:hypothetical protein
MAILKLLQVLWKVKIFKIVKYCIIIIESAGN